MSWLIVYRMWKNSHSFINVKIFNDEFSDI